MLGTVLKDRYRVEARLGEGGMGVIYRAQDTLLNRPVAIKSLVPALAGEEGVRRLLREAQAAAQLTHPNIVSVYDVIDEGDTRLIVMEYVEGRAMSEIIPLGVPRALDLAIQVCRALEYAHSRRVIHRDIKPENIIVTSGNVAKVADFGLARSEGRSRLTQSGLIVGTVAYMAPEQVLGGTVDGRSDLYSLGCVLYEVLTGRRPFEGDDPFTMLSQHVNVMPVAPRWHNGAIPPTLDAIIMRLLAKDPAERYQTAAAVVEGLELVSAEPDAEVPVAAEAPASRTALLQRIVRGRLVGRAAELQELREHLDRMLGGDGRLVLLSGEPGIGKTRLSEELAVYAHLRGAWVLRGHCYEQEVGVPYLPFMETLRQLYQHTGQALLQTLGERADDLGHLLPDLGRGRAASAVLTPDDERIRVFDGVAQWVAAASRQRPLVFALDDLHWGDRASLRLLHHLARHTRGERVLMLGTYREMDLDLQHPFNDVLSEMNRERLFYRLPLRRLPLDDTRALLSGLFDVEVSAELAGAIYGETEGNPFFIEEVVKSLVEEGKIYREEGRWQRQLTVEELEIPQSVRAVIGKRVQKAGEACRRVLTIAAIVGREFDPDLLLRVSGLEEEQVLDALDEAVRLQLIREVRMGRTLGYAFEHALIRQTLYESLNPRRRARQHLQVGEAVEDLYRARLDDHLEELAYHFGEAGLAAVGQGIEYNLRAARKAALLFALEEAERRLAAARELAEAAEDMSAQVRVVEALGDLYLNFAERRRAMEAYQHVLTLLKSQGDERSDQVIRLYCSFAEAGAGFATDPAPAAAECARRAVELLHDRPDQPVKARALSLLALHQVRSGELAASRTTAQAAIDLATRLDDRQELVKAYQAMASVHRSSNEWNSFVEVLEKRRSLAGSAYTSADVDLYWDSVQGALHVGNFQEAERLGREFVEFAEKLRSPTALFSAYNQLGSTLFWTGKWDEAMRLTDRAVELGERIGGVELIKGWSLVRSAWILAGRGEEEAARERLSRIDALGYEVPPEHQSPRLMALDIAHRLQDEQLLAHLLGRAEAEKPRCLTCTLIFYLLTGKARLRVGDVKGAQERLEAARQIMPEQPTPEFLSGLASLQGSIEGAVGHLDAAVEHLEEALQGLADQPFDIDQALLREDIARIYIQRGGPGDAERAGALLAPALRLYEAAGARRFAARARQLLGGPPASPT
jgi:tetratricopeptide (TPR) repeat protein